MSSEVQIADPSMRIVCGLQSITLQRKAGGEVRFLLVDLNEEYIANRFQYIRLRKQEQFKRLWRFLLREKNKDI